MPPVQDPGTIIDAIPGDTLRVCQLFTGLGGGNIGDEIMARAFWSCLPPAFRLNVQLSEEAVESRAAYPLPHRYTSIAPRHTFWRAWQAIRDPFHAQAGLIAGTTPVTEEEGPEVIQAVARRLRSWASLKRPVDAVGIGADRLFGAEARTIFDKQIRPVVRSWSVRTTECRDALLELGVPSESVVVGADWAWIWSRQTDCSDWAADVWKSLGIDVTAPLLVANIVHLNWSACHEAKNATAAALDRVSRSHGLQIALFCNDFRRDPSMDRAAAQDMASRMQGPVVLVPAEFYSPDEALALLSHADVTLGQRYHFVVESVLAGSIPVAIPRMQKMTNLVSDLGCPASGRIDRVDRDDLAAVIADALARRDFWRSAMAAARKRLAIRAGSNFDLIRRLPPYDRISLPPIRPAL